MSLIFMDSFDHYTTADIDLKWTSNASATIAPTTGRRSGGTLSLGAAASANIDFTAAQTAIIGVAHNPSALTALGNIIKFYDGATLQVSIKIDSDGSIKAYRGDTTALLGGSAPTVITTGNFRYIEAKVKIHATTGTVDVYVTPTQGDTPILALSLTGQNTQASGNALCGTAQLYGPVGTTLFDDLYICDDSGTVNNDFLGDQRVDTIYPIADGTYMEFVPSPWRAAYPSISYDETNPTIASDPLNIHYETVDDMVAGEHVPGASDYNTGEGVMDRDSYEFDHIRSVTGTISGIQVNSAALKTTADPGNIQNLIRTGSTDGYSDAIVVEETSAYARSVHELNPTTGAAWTELQVNQAEYGVRVA